MAGIVYVWLGEKCDPEEGRIAEDIACWMFNVSHQPPDWLLYIIGSS